MEKVFSDHSEPLNRELRAYIEDWKILSMNKYDQSSHTRFLDKYGGIYIYDIDTEKRYSIDDKEIHFVNGDGYALVCNPYHLDETSTDHINYCIHDDLFDGIL